MTDRNKHDELVTLEVFSATFSGLKEVAQRAGDTRADVLNRAIDIYLYIAYEVDRASLNPVISELLDDIHQSVSSMTGKRKLVSVSLLLEIHARLLATASAQNISTSDIADRAIALYNQLARITTRDGKLLINNPDCATDTCRMFTLDADGVSN